MPQMAPLPWLLLMIFFILALFIFCSLVFYIYKPSIPQLSLYSMEKSSKNWKW